ncbi:MAG TPA: hypothetical protein VGE52_08015 [Pirellulales bacterium]
MPSVREVMNKVLADGRVDGRELTALGDLLYGDEMIDRSEAEFLVELRSRVQRGNPAFEKFFFQAIKRHLLTDGVVDAEETAWLQRTVLSEGALKGRELKLIREVRGEADAVCDEFEFLYTECVK